VTLCRRNLRIGVGLRTMTVGRSEVPWPRRRSPVLARWELVTNLRYAIDGIYFKEYIYAIAEVVGTDEFVSWYDLLDADDTEAVTRVVERLAQLGVTLGFPYSTAIQGSRYPLRELRVQSGGRPLRVFYAFDPERQAVLLLGGDKTGDDRFYQTFVPRAETIWEAYLKEQAGGTAK
jgi:hypothetical protein